MRHQQYAVAEGISVSGGGIGSAIVVAGRYLDGDASQGRANGGSESNLPDGKASDAPIEFEQQPLEETRADPAPALIPAVDRHRPQGTSNARLHAPRPGPTARTQSLPSKLVNAPPRKPVRVASAQGMGSGLFGSSGGNKLRWPGDAR